MEALDAILRAEGCGRRIPNLLLYIDTPEDIEIVEVKFLLLCFESMSELHINFHKTEVMVLGTKAVEQQRRANMLNCKQGTFPFT
jgi:hypothetical protein